MPTETELGGRNLAAMIAENSRLLGLLKRYECLIAEYQEQCAKLMKIAERCTGSLRKSP